MGRAEKRRIERHQKATQVNKHNDRNFDLSLAEHIDQDRLNRNLYWNFYTNRIYTHEEKIKENIPSFSTVENAYYNTMLMDGLNAKNERYIKNRHKERVQTMQQYQYNEKTCPLETIFQFGDKNHKIPMDLFQKIFLEQIEWEQKTFPNVVIVDWAIHGDETVDHAHTRAVFIAYDKDDNLIVNKSKALEEMGLERPDPSKKPSRYNNVMMTYTEKCREHLLEVCLKYGLDDINYEPQEASKSGKSLQQYQYEEDKKRNAELQNENQVLTDRVTQLETKIGDYQTQIEDYQNACFDWADKCQVLQLEYRDTQDKNQKLQEKTQELTTIVQELLDKKELTDTDIIEQQQKLNQINAEAKEAFYLKESLQKDIEPLQSIIDRHNRLKKQYDKKIKSSKLHPDYWLVHDDIVTEFLNVKSQAGQTLADQTALERREKELKAKEEEIAHYQNAERSHAELNKQLYAKIKSFDKDVEKAKEQTYAQALVDVSEALNMTVSAIKKEIEKKKEDYDDYA